MHTQATEQPYDRFMANLRIQLAEIQDLEQREAFEDSTVGWARRRLVAAALTIGLPLLAVALAAILAVANSSTMPAPAPARPTPTAVRPT